MKLLLIRTACCATAIAVALSACQKEVDFQMNGNPPGTPGGGGGGGTNSLIGTWRFVGMDVKTKSTVTTIVAPDVISSITTSDYPTVNNSGTVTIDANNITSSNLAYSVDTTVHNIFLLNGAVEDEIDLDFRFDVPATSGTGAYKLIGTDSLYYPNGGVTSTPSTDPNNPPLTPATGSRISWSGDTLKLRTFVADSRTVSSGGATGQQVYEALQIVKLVK